MTKIFLGFIILLFSFSSSFNSKNIVWRELKVEKFNEEWSETFQAYLLQAQFSKKQKKLNDQTITINGVINCIDFDSISPVYWLSEKKINWNSHPHEPDMAIELPNLPMKLDYQTKHADSHFELTGQLKINFENEAEHLCYILENSTFKILK